MGDGRELGEAREADKKAEVKEVACNDLKRGRHEFSPSHGEHSICLIKQR